MILILCLFDHTYYPTENNKVQSVLLGRGLYQLQLWGAQGGSITGEFHSTGSKGGYANGTVMLSSPMTLHLFIGTQPELISRGYHTDIKDQLNGGWNGGGSGGDTWTQRNDLAYHRYFHCAGGGGGTDISLVSSPMEYQNYQTDRTQESLEARLIVAGGGAGAFAFRHDDTVTESQGDAQGGGKEGRGPYPGKQDTAGGSGRFGNGANWEGTASRGGGGGGWCGGGNTELNGRFSGGGSGYFKRSPTAEGDIVVLLAGNLIAGDEEFLSPTGQTETGHSGDGVIRITQLRVPTDGFTFDFARQVYGRTAFIILCIAGVLCIPVFARQEAN